MVKKNTGAGLRGQAAGETAICTVGAEGNSLRYRGYDVVELAEGSTFNEVAHMILKGELPTQAHAREVETRALTGCENWCRGLEAFGLKQERRPLRVRPADMSWNFPAPDVLEVSLTLPPGAYATTVLREIARISHRPPPQGA